MSQVLKVSLEKKQTHRQARLHQTLVQISFLYSGIYGGVFLLLWMHDIPY